MEHVFSSFFCLFILKDWMCICAQVFEKCQCPALTHKPNTECNRNFLPNVLDDEYLALISQEHLEQKNQKYWNSIIMIVQLTSIEQM